MSHENENGLQASDLQVPWALYITDVRVNMGLLEYSLKHTSTTWRKLNHAKPSNLPSQRQRKGLNQNKEFSIIKKWSWNRVETKCACFFVEPLPRRQYGRRTAILQRRYRPLPRTVVTRTWEPSASHAYSWNTSLKAMSAPYRYKKRRIWKSYITTPLKIHTRIYKKSPSKLHRVKSLSVPRKRWTR